LFLLLLAPLLPLPPLPPLLLLLLQAGPILMLQSIPGCSAMSIQSLLAMAESQHCMQVSGNTWHWHQRDEECSRSAC
jgi:hypothetical protein